MCCSSDRWTCPACGRTIVIGASPHPEATRRWLRERQAAHQQAHTLAEMVRTELPPYRRHNA